MKQFILGCLVGASLMGTLNAFAGKDSLGRSPQQQQYDYYRQRQMFLDVGHMRQQMERQEFDRKVGRKPC